jgi:hypothetical protein
MQAIAETLQEAMDHIETLEDILELIEKQHPEAVDEARAQVAALRKDQHF